MKNIVLILLIVIAIATKQSLAENKHKMDSLKMELKKAKKDTVKLKIYEALFIECDINDNLTYGTLMMDLADKLINQSTTYKEKKKYVSYSLKVIIVSFIIYSVNITYYKHLCKMQENTNKPKVEKEKVHEGQQKNVNKQHIIKEGIKPKKS